MLPALDYIYLILYPVCAMLGALAFADKSERRMEEERTSGKKDGPPARAHPHHALRAGLSILVFEIVNLLYIYLSGIRLDMGHYSRALISIMYTTALAGLIQLPIRRWLKVHKLKKAAAAFQ